MKWMNVVKVAAFAGALSFAVNLAASEGGAKEQDTKTATEVATRCSCAPGPASGRTAR